MPWGQKWFNLEKSLGNEQQIMWDEIQDMPGEIFDIKEEDWMAVFDDSPEENFDRETKKLLDQF